MSDALEPYLQLYTHTHIQYTWQNDFNQPMEPTSTLTDRIAVTSEAAQFYSSVSVTRYTIQFYVKHSFFLQEARDRGTHRKHSWKAILTIVHC